MIQFDYLSMKDMVADGLTKALTAEKFSQFVRLLGLVSTRIPHNEGDSEHAAAGGGCCR